MRRRLTSISLPPELHARAKRCAKRRGMTFGELVREALEEKISGEEAAGRDPLFRPVPVPEGVRFPPDFVRNLDDYLYGTSS